MYIAQTRLNKNRMCTLFNVHARVYKMSFCCQLLDLKLALFLPFLAVMQPGVFITASDDIEVFNIDRIPPAGNINKH